MKHIKLLTIGLAAATSLFLAGCSEGDHAGPDHRTDHADHDHSGDVAGKVADSAGAELTVIENPTAAQLAAAKPYLLETCIVSDEELGDMGEPVVLIVGNQQVKLCCDSCLSDLKKDSAKLLAKLSK